MTGTEPFSREVLERLAHLIPADAIVGYRDELVGDFPHRVVERVELPDDPIPPDVQDAAQPLCHEDPLRNERRRHERRALKLSDLLTRRQMRRLAFYNEVWKPLGVDDSLRVWLPAPQGHGRQLYLERGKLTPSNAALVARAAKIIDLLGSSVATPAPSSAPAWWSPRTRTRASAT